VGCVEGVDDGADGFLVGCKVGDVVGNGEGCPVGLVGAEDG